MDPFSLTVGIIGLVDGGLSLSKELKEKIDDFRDAGREVIELAHEIDLCTTLLDVLGESLDRPENAYPKNVVKQTKRLVEDMKAVFDDVKDMLMEYDYSAKASGRYMIHAETLRGHHEKLKGLQLSFIFMLSICPAQRAPIQAVSAGGGVLTQAGSFEGTIQHVPVYSGSRGESGDAPGTYKATLTLQPTASPQATAGASGASGAAGTSPDFTDKLEEARKNRRLKKKLAALTSNPFFSKETFSSVFSRPTTQAAAYADIQPRMNERVDEEIRIQPRSRASSEKQAETEVDEILTYLFENGDTKTEPSRKTEPEIGPDAELNPGLELEPYPERRPSDSAAPYLTTDDIELPSRAIPQSYRTQVVQPSSRSPSDTVRGPPSRYSTPQQYHTRPPSGTTCPSTHESSSSIETYRCDDCGQQIMNVIRYKCSLCDDFDLCEQCFEHPTRQHEHPKERLFARWVPDS